MVKENTLGPVKDIDLDSTTFYEPDTSPSTKARGRSGPESVMCKVFEDVVIETIRNGGSRADAGRAIGVTGRTIWNHAKRSPEFAKRYREAQHEMKMKAIRRVTESEDPKIALQYLERRHGKEWGRKVTQELTGKDGGPIQITQVPYDLGKLKVSQLLQLRELRLAMAVSRN